MSTHPIGKGTKVQVRADPESGRFQVTMGGETHLMSIEDAAALWAAMGLTLNKISRGRLAARVMLMGIEPFCTALINDRLTGKTFT